MKVFGMTGAFSSDVWIDGKSLSPAQSQAVYNHSPDGFAWGYGGSGPAQLALAILLQGGCDEQTALRHYLLFKSEVLVPLDKDRDVQLEVDVPSWIIAVEDQQLDAVRFACVRRLATNA